MTAPGLVASQGRSFFLRVLWYRNPQTIVPRSRVRIEAKCASVVFCCSQEFAHLETSSIVPRLWDGDELHDILEVRIRFSTKPNMN